VTFANPNGSIKSVDDQRATLVDGGLLVTGSASARSGSTLTLVKVHAGPTRAVRRRITFRQALHLRCPCRVPPAVVAAAAAVASDRPCRTGRQDRSKR